jgi:transglutaminase-like putative cysteine protease
MKIILMIVKTVLFAALGIILGLPLYALPATLSLPRGLRPGLKRLTISQAARQLRGMGKTGWSLVEAARALVTERMHYCRRNSFDPAAKAFERGYGYCQQQSYALADILTELGFEAKVVGAFRNRLPGGRVGGHAWVSVTLDGETRDVDSLHYSARARKITFTPLTEVFNYTPVSRVFFGWGSAAVNAHRYYLTGKDM